MKFLTIDDSRDFPFYNNNPRVSKKGWFCLFFCWAFFTLFGIYFMEYSELIGSLIFCFGLLIPLLYFVNWDYRRFFYKPTRNELILAVSLFIIYIVYALAIGSVLDYFGLSSTVSPYKEVVTVESLFSLIFSMMGEELVKLIPFLFLMRVVYKYSENRYLAIGVSTVIVLLFFGFLHYDPPYSTLAEVLITQGVGSLTEMYGYIRTKNLWVPYIAHFLTDFSVYLLMFIGWV